VRRLTARVELKPDSGHYTAYTEPTTYPYRNIFSIQMCCMHPVRNVMTSHAVRLNKQARPRPNLQRPCRSARQNRGQTMHDDASKLIGVLTYTSGVYHYEEHAGSHFGSHTRSTPSGYILKNRATRNSPTPVLGVVTNLHARHTS
jgi:hypothetical protein